MLDWVHLLAPHLYRGPPFPNSVFRSFSTRSIKYLNQNMCEFVYLLFSFTHSSIHPFIHSPYLPNIMLPIHTCYSLLKPVPQK